MTSIFVAKLDFGVSNQELRQLFENYGTVLKATVATDRETGKPRGFAFVEMADRRVEWTILLGAANSIRHSHPGLATLEQPQFPEYGQSQTAKLKANLQVFDKLLQTQDWMAGERFTIADITAFCALEFARGLLKFKPADLGYEALQAWRERMAARPAAQVL